MNVTFSPDIEEWMKERVASGEYGSTSELIRAAVWELRNQSVEKTPRINEAILKRLIYELREPEIKTFDDLKREVEKGMNSGTAGIWNREMRESILREASLIQELRRILTRESASE